MRALAQEIVELKRQLRLAGGTGGSEGREGRLGMVGAGEDEAGAGEGREDGGGAMEMLQEAETEIGRLNAALHQVCMCRPNQCLVTL